MTYLDEVGEKRQKASKEKREESVIEELQEIQRLLKQLIDKLPPAGKASGN